MKTLLRNAAIYAATAAMVLVPAWLLFHGVLTEWTLIDWAGTAIVAAIVSFACGTVIIADLEGYGV